MVYLLFDYNNRACLLLFILISIFQLSYQKSTQDSNSYIAVVVEYGPQDPTSPQDSPVQRNGEVYASYIQQAGKRDADIIVFPEDGLTSLHLPSRSHMNLWSTLVPLNYIPCNQTTIPVNEVLNSLSCAAKDSQIYVVINIAEKLPCNEKNCPDDKVYYFNCQVVFDREGKIIAKYRKTHLFSEPQFNTTPEPEIVTFQTDFGVTFGTFICFDILFKEPGLTLTRTLNVTDIVYSTAWFSELPFLSAVQTQYAWSYAEDVNFLASGYNRVEYGNAGSGIYLGRNGICKTRTLKAGNELIICNVPKKDRNINLIAVDEAAIRLKENRQNAAEIHVHDELRKREVVNMRLYHDDLTQFKSVDLNSSLQHTLCDGNFCCEFDVEISYVDPNSVYKLIAFDGVRTFMAEPITVGIQACALVQCANDSITSCGVRLNSETTFNSIRINATFIDYEDIIILPSSVDVNLLPLPNWTYKQYFDGNQVHIKASLDSSSVKDLLTCGLYVRIFTKDVQKNSSSIISTLQIATIIALIAISIFFLFLYRKGWRVPIRRGSQADQEPYHSLQSSSKK